MHAWKDGWMGRWMDGWMDEWMDGWMNGWMDGWMNGAYVEVEPEDEDEMTDDVDDAEGNEDVSFHFDHERYSVLDEDRYDRMPDADDAQDDQRQQHVLILATRQHDNDDTRKRQRLRTLSPGARLTCY